MTAVALTGGYQSSCTPLVAPTDGPDERKILRPNGVRKILSPMGRRGLLDVDSSTRQLTDMTLND
jgi:hypothetical protein